MSIVLHQHPFSRASNVVWMLEELGVDYELRFVDIMTGTHKADAILALNPMGKLPILTDGSASRTSRVAAAVAPRTATVTGAAAHWAHWPSTADAEFCGPGDGRTMKSALLLPIRSRLPRDSWPPPGSMPVVVASAVES